MYDRATTSDIVMVDMVIFIKKEAQYKISIIVLKEIGTPQHSKVDGVGWRHTGTRGPRM